MRSVIEPMMEMTALIRFPIISRGSVVPNGLMSVTGLFASDKVVVPLVEGRFADAFEGGGVEGGAGSTQA
jgi:hypothetical protein